MADLAELKAHLIASKDLLVGEWVGKNSAYDEGICRALSMTKDGVRYWDANWRGILLEFKKGRSVWLDLVRYGEMVLKTNADASMQTLTLFFLPDVQRKGIEEIICVDTRAIISRLGLTKSDAEKLIELSERVPRSLNAQASLTIKDVKQIAHFSV